MEAAARGLNDIDKKTPVAGQPNRANEKQSSGSVPEAIRRDFSSNAAASHQADANILLNTRSAKNKVIKFNNGDYE